MRPSTSGIILYAAIVIGLIMLAWSVVNLQTIFLSEHDRALSSLRDKRATLETYAVEHFSNQLMEQQGKAINQVSAIVNNPLQSNENILWVSNGLQRLPLIWSFRETAIASSEKIYNALITGKNVEDVKVDDVAYFGQVSLSLKKAVSINDTASISQSMKALMQFRVRNRLPASIELAATLAILELFDDHEKASVYLITKLVRDGVSDKQGNELLGLQSDLLFRRNKLSRKNFEFLSKKIYDYSLKHGISADDFWSVVNQRQNQIRFPDVEQHSGVLWNKQWFIQRHGNEVIGIKIDLEKLIEYTHVHMQSLKLIKDGESFQFKKSSNSELLLDSVHFRWESEQWSARKSELDYYHATKRVLLFACCLIFLSVIAVVWNIYRRQQRWIGLRSEFISTVSHELRTPLSSIRLMAERLAHRLKNNDRARDYPQRIIGDIDTLSFLVENILSYNRLQSGKWRAEKSHVLVADQVHQLKQEIGLYTTKSVQLNISGDESATLYVDPLLLKILLINLAKNACLYNVHSKVILGIHVTVADKVIIDISDNGQGIDPCEHKDIYEAFYRGKSQRHCRGSGLGLALCLKIVHLHNGNLFIKKTGSSGTTFTIELPKPL